MNIRSERKEKKGERERERKGEGREVKKGMFEVIMNEKFSKINDR